MTENDPELYFTGNVIVHTLYLCDLESRKPFDPVFTRAPVSVATKHTETSDGARVVVERDTTWGDILSWLVEDGPDSSTPLVQAATGSDLLWVEIEPHSRFTLPQAEASQIEDALIRSGHVEKLASRIG